MKNRALARMIMISVMATSGWQRAPAGDANVEKLRCEELARNFVSPPDSAKPWAFWFWINGNISKEGITADLEALHRGSVGGVIWMEVGGKKWPPDGKVKPYSPQWHDCMQWAISECARLGMKFDLSVNFGYGSGGPHITPDHSMQRLCWNETTITGGRKVDELLKKPQASPSKLLEQVESGGSIEKKVSDQILNMDSYRDIAVIAIPAPTSDRQYRIPELKLKDGTSWMPPNSTLLQLRAVERDAWLPNFGGLLRWLFCDCGAFEQCCQ